jgi:hypothetical protein
MRKAELVVPLCQLFFLKKKKKTTLEGRLRAHKWEKDMSHFAYDFLPFLAPGTPVSQPIPPIWWLFKVGRTWREVRSHL